MKHLNKSFLEMFARTINKSIRNVYIWVLGTFFLQYFPTTISFIVTCNVFYVHYRNEDLDCKLVAHPTNFYFRGKTNRYILCSLFLKCTDRILKVYKVKEKEAIGLRI